MRNYLDCCIQKVVVNSSIFGRTSVTSGVPQGAVLGPVLFIIYIKAINNRVKCTINKFADVPERWNAIQRHLGKLEKWARVNFMKFKKAKCKALHLGRGNLQY